MSLQSLSKRAFVKTASIPGAVVQLAIDGAAPMRALASNSSSTLNAMRGRLDNKQHWQVAVLVEEIPAGKKIAQGVKVRLTGGEVGVGAAGYSGTVEEGDLFDDGGLLTFFVS